MQDNIIKIPFPPITIYRFNAISIKLSGGFCVDTANWFYNWYLNVKDLDSHTNMKKGEQSWKICTTWFLPCSRTRIIETVWHWGQDRYIGNGTECYKKINSHINDKLIFNSSAKGI